MKTTKRFDTAVTKLYKAFNEGTLNANDCQHCAVGNLCDTERNQIRWDNGNVLGSIREELDIDNPRIIVPTHEEFSSEELFEIERLFLLAHQEYAIKSGMAESVKIISIDFRLQTRITKQKEAQFEGLMAVINYLAELDNIEVPQITINQFELVLEKEKL